MSLNATPTPPPREHSAAIRRRQFVESLCDRLLRPGRHWVLVSVAMYAIACVLPAMPPVFDGDNPIRGYVCLITLSDPIVHVYAFPCWWANPIYFVAVIASLLNRPRIAVVFAVVAALLAMNFELMCFYSQGFSNAMKELLPGCLMWIASLQLLACHELWRQWLDWQRRVYERELGPTDITGTA